MGFWRGSAALQRDHVWACTTRHVAGMHLIRAAPLEPRCGSRLCSALDGAPPPQAPAAIPGREELSVCSGPCCPAHPIAPHAFADPRVVGWVLKQRQHWAWNRWFRAGDGSARGTEQLSITAFRQLILLGVAAAACVHAAAPCRAYDRALFASWAGGGGASATQLFCSPAPLPAAACCYGGHRAPARRCCVAYLNAVCPHVGQAHLAITGSWVRFHARAAHVCVVGGGE